MGKEEERLSGEEQLLEEEEHQQQHRQQRERKKDRKEQLKKQQEEITQLKERLGMQEKQQELQKAREDNWLKEMESLKQIIRDKFPVKQQSARQPGGASPEEQSAQQEEIKALTLKNAALERELTTLREANKAQQTENMELKKKNVTLNGQVQSQIQQAFKYLEGRPKETLIKAISQERQKVKQMERELAKCKDENRQLRSEKAQHEDEKNKLKQEIGSMREKEKAKMEEVAKLHKEINELKMKQVTMEGEMKSLMESNRQQQEELAALWGTHENAEHLLGQSDICQEQIDKLESKLAEVRRERNYYIQQIHRTEDQEATMETKKSRKNKRKRVRIDKQELTASPLT